MLKYMQKNDVQYLIKVEDKSKQNYKRKWIDAIGKRIRSQ